MMNNPRPGETWVSRSGEKFTIFDIRSEGEEHPMMALDDKKRFVQFTRNGRYVNDKFEHKLDLIKKL